MLPLLDGYGSGPPAGAVGAATGPPGAGGVQARASEGSQLEVYRKCPILAVPSPPLGMRPDRVAPLLAPLWDLGPVAVRCSGVPTPQAWTRAPQRRALQIKGRDNVAEGSGGHWVGVTHDGTFLCLCRRDRSLAMPPDHYAEAHAVRSLGYMPCGTQSYIGMQQQGASLCTGASRG